MRWVAGPGNTRRAVVLFLLALAGAATAADDVFDYRVVRGDTLIGIAGDLLERPDQWRELQRLNAVRQPRRMPVGTVLQIPLDWLRGEPAVATLVSHTNQVERLLPDGRAEILASGAALHVADVLRTAADAAAVIELIDGSRVQLAPDSRVTLLQLMIFRGAGNSGAVLQLHEGRAESSVQPGAPRPRFEIRTPVMTLGVRGTEFRAHVGGNQAHVEVTRGNVVARQATGAGTKAAALAAVNATAVAAGYGLVASESGLTPPQPLLPAPDLGAVPALTERLPLRLAWAGEGGAAGWRAQVRSAAEPSRLLLEGRFDAPAARWADLPDGNYVLRVRAIDAQGLEGADAEVPFTLKARPEPPLIQEPRQGSLHYGSEAQWRWALNSDAARYRLQVSAEASFKAPVVDQQALAEPTLSLPLAPGDWHWRIASVRADGDQGPWSDVQAFSQREVPPAPTIDDPKVDGDRLALRWSRRAPDDRYRIQLARDAAFSDLIADQELSEPEFEIDKPSPGTYYLRVRTLAADGHAGPWGAPSTLELPIPMWLWILPAALLLILL